MRSGTLTTPMRLSPAPLVLLSTVAASLACAQTPAKEPAGPLEVPTQSRAARAHLETADAVAAALEGRGDQTAVLEGGAAIATSLAQVINTAAHPLERRVRAVTLLGRLSGPEALPPLELLLRDGKAEPPLRAAAAVALAHRQGAASVPGLKALLGDAEPVLRIGAARALAAIASDEARGALEERLASEPDRSVREALQHALTRTHP